MSTTHLTPQRIIRDWVAEHSAANPDISRRAIVDAARTRFAADPEFTDVLLDWAFAQLVPREADRLMRTEGRVKTGDGWVTRDELARRASAPGSPWEQWRDRYTVIGRDGVMVGLPDMTREHLIDAANTRREVVRDALVGVAFLTKVAGALTGEQRVKDVFTPEELADAYAASQNLKVNR